MYWFVSTVNEFTRSSSNKKAYSRENGMSLNSKGILILQLPVNETICGEILSQDHKINMADVVDMGGISSSLPD